MLYISIIITILFSYIFAFLVEKGKFINYKFLLLFSSGYLLGTVFNHILPEIFFQENSKEKGILIILGIVFQIILENISKGIEHGKLYYTNNIRSFYFIFSSLLLYSFIEGCIISVTDDIISWAIIVHKIPISIIVYSFLKKILSNKIIFFLLLFIFMISTPFGILMGNSNWIIEYQDNYVLPLVSGIFIYISMVTLFEEKINEYDFDTNKVLLFIWGMLFSYIML